MDSKTVLENEPQKAPVAAKSSKWDDVVAGVQRVIAVFWKRVSSLARRAGLWMAVSILGLIAILLFGVGLRFQNSLLQGLGGLFAGTALTLMVTILTGKEAVKQQNAKDANINRKDRLYIPVFNELKSIQDRWENAANRREPYPRYVQGVGNESPDFMGRPLNYPAFASWPMFKEGPQKSDFTERASRLLDKVQEVGASYNQAVSNAKEPIRRLLDSHIKEALFNERNDQTFKEWEVVSKQNPSATWSFPRHYWYEYIQTCTVPPESANQVAETWVWAYNSIGWMIVGDIEGASAQIRSGYINVTQRQDPQDTAWFKAVLEKAWTEIDTLPEIHQVRTLAQELSLAVNETKSHVDKGLRYIQEMYEGGEPPI
jgi:hypothetical protein